MKQAQKGFTTVELVVVIAVMALVGGVLACTGCKGKNELVQCTTNLSLIGKGLLLFEMQHKAAPAFDKASATTITDGKLTAANLMQLYAKGLVKDLNTFRCPYGDFAPASADAAATPGTVKKDRDGSKYTAYNLTTCYAMSDPANKIIVADMPFAKGNVAASTHDSSADAIDNGPNCLFKDGHVQNVKNLCPGLSSEHDLSPKGNIYRVDSGEGKGKDTCILGVDR